jgi:hypothetical protein
VFPSFPGSVGRFSGLVTDYFDVTACSDLRSDVYKLEDDLSA